MLSECCHSVCHSLHYLDSQSQLFVPMLTLPPCAYLPHIPVSMQEVLQLFIDTPRPLAHPFLAACPTLPGPLAFLPLTSVGLLFTML